MNWRWVEVVVFVAILGTIACFFWPSFGSLHYFSPDTLESGYRTTTFLPGSDVPAYRSVFKSTKSELIQFLIENEYWKPATQPSPRWIMTGSFCDRWKDGQSHLHSELYWHDHEWVKWSEQNPERAADLWPRVLAIIRGDPIRGQDEAFELMWQAKHDAIDANTIAP